MINGIVCNQIFYIHHLLNINENSMKRPCSEIFGYRWRGDFLRGQMSIQQWSSPKTYADDSKSIKNSRHARKSMMHWSEKRPPVHTMQFVETLQIGSLQTLRQFLAERWASNKTKNLYAVRRQQKKTKKILPVVTNSGVLWFLGTKQHDAHNNL